MSSTQTELADHDPDLQTTRAALAAREASIPSVDPEQMFAALRTGVARERSSVRGALGGRSTAVRTAVVLSFVGAIATYELALHGRVAFAQAPTRVAVSLGAFAALVVMVLLSSLRPMHRPALSARTERLLAGGPLLVAVGLSLWPTTGASGTLVEAWSGATPCLMYGLAVAVPVYAVTRLVDRGAWITGLLATIGAGLAANFVLMTHCPTAGADHMLLGHSGVFVAMLLGFSAWSRVRSVSTR